MAAGVAKLRLIIDMQNKLKAGLDTAKVQVEKATGYMQGRLNQFKLHSAKVFDAIKSEIPIVGRAVALLANPYVAATAAVLTLGAGIVKCTGMANDWEKQMSDVNVTAELTKTKLGELSNKLLEIGSRNAVSLEQIPQAYNRIISAGLRPEDALRATEPTVQASKAFNTDIETTASAGVSVMMAAGREANEVFDILTQTVKEGNAEFKDIAQYLPKVIPMAKNVGLELEETAGAYASLTGKLSAMQASTALQGITRALSSENVLKGFDKIGVKVFDENNNIRPMLDIVKDLSAEMQGLSDKERILKFEQLGLDQMGAVGFSTLIQDVAGLEKAINATTESSGALAKAVEDSKKPFDSWVKIQNNVKIAMIKIGQVFLPIASSIGEKVLEVIDYFKNLYEESALLRDIVSLIGKILKIAFSIAIVPIKIVVSLFKGIFALIGGTIGQIKELISNVTGLATPFKDLYNTIRPYLMWIMEMLSSIGGFLYDVITFNISGMSDRLSNFKLPSLDDIKMKIAVETQKESEGDFAGLSTGNEPEGDPTSTTKSTNTLGEDVKTIGSGSQSKTVNIKIDSMIKNYQPAHQSVNNMSKDEVTRWMEEIFIRLAHSAEKMA